jgi:hypothetical protein
MFVPVTTKPYLNSVNFKVLQRISLHFFLLIKEKTNQHFISCENGIHGYVPQRKLWNSYPPLCGIIRLTNITALRLKYLSLINKGGFL